MLVAARVMVKPPGPCNVQENVMCDSRDMAQSLLLLSRTLH
jgi:hypothetical protein